MLRDWSYENDADQLDNQEPTATPELIDVS